MRSLVFLILSITLLISCKDDGSGKKYNNIDDLAFHEAKDSKAYTDLILRAIRTNRDKVVATQFVENVTIDDVKLNQVIGSYSQAIGRKEWDYVDNFEDSGKTSADGGYDYTWYDKKGRIGMQIHVKSTKEGGLEKIEKMEFRSRIDALESEAFPGGEISDYKK